MSYAFVQDIAASWHDYERVVAETLEPTPGGLILHVAGPTTEGFRIIEVWETAGSGEQFRVERLAPAIAALGWAHRAQPRFRDFRALHLVLGAATSARQPVFIEKREG